MCIRDSLYIALHVGHFFMLIRKKSFKNTAAAKFVYVFNTCLLYTSDAADERSSVDLGGRRIIKKKNSRRHGG